MPEGDLSAEGFAGPLRFGPADGFGPADRCGCDGAKTPVASTAAAQEGSSGETTKKPSGGDDDQTEGKPDARLASAAIKAKDAGHAEEADHARSSDHAVDANHATNAEHAKTADNATNAKEAESAKTAKDVDCQGCVGANEVDPAGGQARVAGSCLGGIAAVQQDGSVLCAKTRLPVRQFASSLPPSAIGGSSGAGAPLAHGSIFFVPMFASNHSSDPYEMAQSMPVPGAVSSFFVHLDQPMPVDIHLTLHKAVSSSSGPGPFMGTTLACTIRAFQTSCSDLVDEAAYTLGDLLVVEVRVGPASASSNSSAATIRWTARLTPSTQTLGRLVFADANGRLQVIRPDGSGIRPLGVTGRHPTVSPDGTEILYADNGIWRMQLDDPSTKEQITTDASDDWPTWSPLGDRLAFSRGGLGDVMVMDLRPGATPKRLTAGSAPRWSPDDSRIAFVRNGAIFAIGPDGGTETATLVTSGTQGRPIWSLDGEELYGTTGSGISLVLPVTPAPKSIAPGTAMEGWDMSPDGRMVVLAAGGDIYVASVWGGAPILVVKGQEPAWAP